MAKYAYVRVSTKEQNIDRQLVALEPYSIPKKNIYCDYQSGKDFNRPAYQKLMRRLKPGEILLPTWIQSHDSFENEPPFEYPLNPLFSNRYQHRKRSEPLTFISCPERFCS